MAYTALFQGHPVRFAAPKGSVSCAPVLDDVLRVLQAIGVDAALVGTPPGKLTTVGTVEFGTLINWLEDLRAASSADVSMFVHWVLRHMPNAQVALGLPLLGYLQTVAVPQPAARQIKRRVAA